MNTPQVIFFGCAFLVAYAYALYPLLIWSASRIWGRKTPRPEVDDAALPSLTLLVAAHNEEAVLGARLENALEFEYPREKLQIVVVSDGSSDRTAEIAQSFADRGVRLLDYQPNRGKSSAVNAAWDEISTDLVLLSDANTDIAPDAARKLARWFRSPEIGTACGRLVLVDRASGHNVDGAYWRYETFLKQCEARLGALLGANGAIYAIRRNAYVPIPAETIVDDFMIPLLARMKGGFRIVYDGEAIAREETAPGIRDEFRRRVRIGAGGFQSLGTLWPLLSPRYGWLAFSFWSHKVLRWLCPFFLLGAFISNCLLVHDSLYASMLGLQAGFYLLAMIGGQLPGGGDARRLIRMTTMFVGMNAALFVGFFRFVSGRQRGTWVRTARL